MAQAQQDVKHMIEKLNDLIALDYDALGAYEAATQRITAMQVRDQLRQFQMDHERHIRDLAEIVVRLGGQARKKPDAKGFLIKGFTAVTSTMGDEAALRAMQGNERLTNSTYAKAMQEGWPQDIRQVIARNYGDEQ